MTKIMKFFKVDFSFLLIFVVAFLLEEIWLYICFAVFTLIHELMHYVVAKRCGYSPKQIKLNFFGACLEGDDDFNLNDEIKIVLAGPIFNLFVVVLCYLMFWFQPESYGILSDVLTANLTIFIFNFLPIFPLDCGRILLAFFSKNKPRMQALKTVKNVSVIFLFLMFVLFLFSLFFEYNFSLGFMCFNLMILTLNSCKDTSYKREFFVRNKLSKIKQGILIRTICVDDKISKFKLFKFIDDYHFVMFVFMSDKGEVVGHMTEIELYENFGLV